MRILILLFFCLCCFNSFSQVIPRFEPMAKENNLRNSKMLTKLLLKFDESILYTADCDWPKSKEYLILGYDGRMEIDKSYSNL